MGRPKRPILLSQTNNLKKVEILDAGEMYCILYDGKHISRASYDLYEVQPPDYSTMAFVSPAQAHNRCARLNAEFGDDKFKVYEVLTVKEIEPTNTIVRNKMYNEERKLIAKAKRLAKGKTEIINLLKVRDGTRTSD